MELSPNQIKQLRKKLGLTQEELAAKIGITLGSISNWELGKSKPSRLGKMILWQFVEEEGVDIEEGDGKQ